MPVKDGRLARTRDSRRILRRQVICPWSENALGIGVKAYNSLGSAAWPTANAALGYPFIVEDIGYTINKAWMESVGNANGVHVDIGVYDENYSKVASLGSTAWTNASLIQTFTFSQYLKPGRYFAVIASDSTGMGNEIIKNGGGDGLAWRIYGCFKATTSFPLPSTITPATYGDDNIPIFGFSGVSAF